eukprot:TRINITY_DN1046_c0_g2_i2.p1 TRINITY_DN1046_c0_g2~~TRINITY_DN1046_c0_g2_i2.p1  ORF type:complete len:604 (+),score=102.82 TRINITY_DN1046_c0_g2_i2:23-1813(+)
MLALCLLASSALAAPPSRCRRGDSCWPSSSDIDALKAKLSPGASRSLVYLGDNEVPCSVPVDSPDDQPLYGFGAAALEELYVEVDADREGVCFVDSFFPDFCLASTRNNPLEGWQPAFVAWPLNANHVQQIVKFAVDHKLAVCVAGTGHDFLNRHSCDQGVLIRMSLLKEKTWDLTANTARFGAGLTWSEAHKSAADNNRMVASGWSISVGIVGWSLGGGHGPYGPSLGLGVDNIVEVELVAADGSLVTANAAGTRWVALDGTVTSTSNNDLYRALRGGGGSTWGVVTALTVRAHPVPSGGITSAELTYSGDMCSGLGTMNATVDAFLDWAQTLDSKWGTLVFMTPTTASGGGCGATWSVFGLAVFQGPQTDANFTAKVNELLAAVPLTPDSSSITPYAGPWQLVQASSVEYVIPVPWLGPSSTYSGGIPSVTVMRNKVADGALAAYLKNQLLNCLASVCNRQELYLDITGNLNSPQATDTMVNPGMRSAMLHLVAGGVPADKMADLYALGDYSYFSESAYNMDTWKSRLWSAAQYTQLLQVKQSVDPLHVFWCRHCIGDEETPAKEWPNASASAAPHSAVVLLLVLFAAVAAIFG